MIRIIKNVVPIWWNLGVVGSVDDKVERGVEARLP